MTEELKPCPFCGGEAKLSSWGEGDLSRFGLKPYHSNVACTNHDCKSMSAIYTADTEAEARQKAINAWNTRVHDDEVSELQPCNDDKADFCTNKEEDEYKAKLRKALVEFVLKNADCSNVHRWAEDIKILPAIASLIL